MILKSDLVELTVKREGLYVTTTSVVMCDEVSTAKCFFLDQEEMCEETMKSGQKPYFSEKVSGKSIWGLKLNGG